MGIVNLTPKQIVAELDRYIIGQQDAKKAVAVALRNRFRRSRLPDNIKDEITPKNIILEGPTGVGKTEIARRLAKLVRAPFVKVEATKFTEVGYVGRDVESIIRDLVEAAIRLVKVERIRDVQDRAREFAEKRVVEALYRLKNPVETPDATGQTVAAKEQTRQELLKWLREGKLDDTIIEIDLADEPKPMELMPGSGTAINIGEMFGGMIPKRRKKRKVTVKEAIKLLVAEESEKLIDNDSVNEEALRRAEQDGIVFIDEIDKIAGREGKTGPDVSREGVQRDILPIVEGSTVSTKYGPIKTDYILFIAAGAFHIARVEDLIPELQGRFPIKVKLKSLAKEDFVNILTVPENAVTKQYGNLLKVDNINLTFAPDAIDEIAEVAELQNDIHENIGARRLHTIMEGLLEDISFNADGNHPMINLKVDRKYVKDNLSKTHSRKDLKEYIL
ncbi:MAG: ATP-dependent protease ATPase subunit HslU [Firmicutes bacterium]|nr:ATP-dependent protease ATPase subunit HslU [Bacillota bacterium]